jgi:cation:H+ antiporter
VALLDVGVLLAGFAVLAVGGQVLVRGASGLARAIGLAPVTVRSRVVRLDVAVMIALSVAFPLLALDGRISTLDGALLLGALVVYVVRPGGRAVPGRRAGGRGSDRVRPARDGRGGPGAAAVVFAGLAVARWEGVLFVGFYLAYMLYLLLDAAEHDALPRFSGVMLGFVIPLTALTLGLLGLAEFRRRACVGALRR